MRIIIKIIINYIFAENGRIYRSNNKLYIEVVKGYI